MKKIVLTLAALMSMMLAFAGDAKDVKNVEIADASKYEMNINIYSLSNTLRLNNEETDYVALVSNDFSADMAKAGAAKGEEREALLKKAVNKNLTYMHAVLSNRQYRNYVKILNATLCNRGIIK